MQTRIVSKAFLVIAFAAMFLTAASGQVFGEAQRDARETESKKDQKKVDKDARKLAEKADEAAGELGRDVVFCILAAHTTGVGTAQQLKDKFTSLGDFPFGQFVAAVIMADNTDKPLDDLLAALQGGKSLGQIAKDLDVNMGELRQGFGQFRSELARSMTNPPTTDCFNPAP